jgi:hypothetical protein
MAIPAAEDQGGLTERLHRRSFSSSHAPSRSRAPLSPAKDQSEVGIRHRFRDAVLSAYGVRCAISRLREPRLLDAAHIVMDAHKQLV